MKILAVVHVFYPEFWPQLADCLRRVNPDHIVVTAMEASVFPMIAKDFPQAETLICENRGFDVWPFLKAINSVKLDDFDLVVKLHTKRDFNEPFEALLEHERNLTGPAWRNLLLDFCASDANWQQTLTRFQDREVGMVANWRLVLGRWSRPQIGGSERTFDRAVELAVADKARRKQLQDNGLFVAGTMFAARREVIACLLKLLSPLHAERFEVSARNGDVFAHVVERLIGICVSVSGMRIEAIDGGLAERLVEIRRQTLRAWRRKKIKSFFYRRKVTSSGAVIIKICKIPIWRYRV